MIESNLEVSEYELTNDHNRHYYSIKSIGNKALFEIDSDNTDCLNVIPLDNPIIDAYRASLFVPNLDSCVCHFILEVDGIESFTFNEDFNFGNLYSYGNQFTFTIQAIPNEKNYLKSEIVTYTLEKLVVNSIISNVKVDNETNSIKFESSLSNKTYDIALVDKKKGEYLFVSDTKELSCPIDVEEGEYTFILGIRSEVDNDIKKIYMSDDSSVEYNFVQ